MFEFSSDSDCEEIASVRRVMTGQYETTMTDGSTVTTVCANLDREIDNETNRIASASKRLERLKGIRDLMAISDRNDEVELAEAQARNRAARKQAKIDNKPAWRA